MYRVGLRTILRLFLLCIVWLRLSTIMINGNDDDDDDHDDRVIVRIHSVPLMNVEQRQAAADPQTWAASPLFYAAIVYNHHRRLLLLLSPKADTHLSFHGG